MSRHVLAWALLVLVYGLALDSFAGADLALGGLLAAALLLVFRGVAPRPGRADDPPLVRRIAAAVPLALVILRDIAAGTWRVALVVTGARPLTSPGIVIIPVGDRTPTGAAVSAILTTLSPGEFLVELDLERGQMAMHVLDARDPDAVRERHARLYDRWQRHVVP